jgi:tryptophan synthase beta subunit
VCYVALLITAAKRLYALSMLTFCIQQDALNSATLTMGKPGVLHGTRTYLLQDSDGQVAIR